MWVIEIANFTTQGEDDVVMQRKAFAIPKSLVWKSYHEVCRNKGAAGYDGQTIAMFNEKRDHNLYKIWNRLSAGSYFPPPVLEKRIPKDDGKERILGIPTVADRIAQGAVKTYIETKLDHLFHQDSYGYRHGKSAHQALEKCRQRCWNYSWVLEIDVSSFFDSVRHDLILQALKHHKMPKWVLLYCERWLQAPMADSKDNDNLKKREIGKPQGGVVSPILANLFLHYAFDKWMSNENKGVLFERYADDIVCHCSKMSDAVRLKQKIEARFKALSLAINDSKSNIVYIDTFQRWNVKTTFTFLGYDFKVRSVKNFKGEIYRKCMPGASMKAMRKITKTIKDWRIHRSTVENAEEFARRYNAILRGWIEYYNKFWNGYFSHHLWCTFQSRLLKWAKAKYRISTQKAERKLELLRRQKPKLFAHWYLLRAANV